MEVLMANPRGFCAGVDRAIEIVERALKLFGAPIYVRHEVVHNRFVVDRLTRDGAVFVDELHEVPDHTTVIFSAHGVSKAVRTAGRERGLTVFDATCPLVTKVHMEVARQYFEVAADWYRLRLRIRAGAAGGEPHCDEHQADGRYEAVHSRKRGGSCPVAQ